MCTTGGRQFSLHAFCYTGPMESTSLGLWHTQETIYVARSQKKKRWKTKEEATKTKETREKLKKKPHKKSNHNDQFLGKPQRWKAFWKGGLFTFTLSAAILATKPEIRTPCTFRKLRSWKKKKKNIYFLMDGSRTVSLKTSSRHSRSTPGPFVGMWSSLQLQ